MRKWNFCAGPAVISEDVLLEVQSETLEYNDIGSSIMEINHRSKIYKNLANEAKEDLKELLSSIFDEFSLSPSEVILGGFSQGGMMTLAAGPLFNLAGLISFSGALLTEKNLEKASKSSPPILLIHGDLDDVVPVSALIDAQSHLEEKGFDVEVVLEKGVGHSIDEKGLDAARKFIDTHLPKE